MLLGKKYLKVFLCCCLGFSSSKSIAQQFLGPIVNIAHTEYMKEHIELYKYTIKVSDYLVSYKMTFTVFFKDGSQKEIISSIKYDTLSNKNFLSYEDKSFSKHDPSHRYIKVFPGETLKITHLDSAGTFNKERLCLGIATDSCWMFKLDSGYITTYSCLCKKREPTNFNTASLIGIQNGRGPIVALNEKNLIEIVGQYYDAREAIQEKNYFRAIKLFNKQKHIEQKKSPSPGT